MRCELGKKHRAWATAVGTPAKDSFRMVRSRFDGVVPPAVRPRALLLIVALAGRVYTLVGTVTPLSAICRDRVLVPLRFQVLRSTPWPHVSTRARSIASPFRNG